MYNQSPKNELIRLIINPSDRELTKIKKPQNLKSNVRSKIRRKRKRGSRRKMATPHKLRVKRLCRMIRV